MTKERPSPIPSVTQFEKFLQVRFSDGQDSTGLLDAISNGLSMQFIVDENYNIILGGGFHNGMSVLNGIDKSRSLIQDGQVRIKNNLTEFTYRTHGVAISLLEATENKIKFFLREKGIKFVE